MYEYLSVGTERVRGDGTVVRVEIEDKLDFTEPSDTAVHEAIHADVAEENGTATLEASIVPSGNARGFVRMSRADPIAAAAPHADGHRGTGHDMRLVSQSGMSETRACSVARRVMAGRRHKIHRLAGHLEYRKRLSGQEIRRARQKIEDGETVKVTIRRPTGERTTVYKHGITDPNLILITFPDLPLEQPLAA